MTIRKTIFFVLAAGLFSLAAIPAVDPDLWWHLKTGQVILTHGIPKVDIYSFTMKGKPWITHEWLSEVFLWSVHACGGIPALIISFALIASLTFGLVYFTCAGSPFLAFPLTLLACWSSRFLWGSRPQIFNILMLAVFLWLLQSVRQRRFRWQWIYAFPFLTALWANLHSGYLMGIAVLVVCVMGETAQIFLRKSEEGTLGKDVLWHLGFVVSLCMLAALINPSGYKIWFYPFETLGSSMMQSTILEWLVPDFHHWNYKPFLITMVLGAIAFMNTRRQRNIPEMMLYGGAMAAGLFSRRHIPFFEVVAIPIISRALLDCFQGPNVRDFLEGKTLSRKTSGIVLIVNIVLVLSVLVATGLWAREQIRKTDAQMRDMYPLEAVKKIKEKGLADKHGLNEYAWGGYLIWNDLPVFIDGRVDMYGDDFFREYMSVHDAQKGWKEMYMVFMRYDVRYILLRPLSLLANLLRANGDWKEVYRDRTASVFILQKSPKL